MIAQEGRTIDPYAERPYPLDGPGYSQTTHDITVPARPHNAHGIRELIRRDALHTHGRDALPGQEARPDELHLWVDYRTVRLIRELRTIDIDDQRALNQWAESVRPDPWDINLNERRHQYGPSWVIELRVRSEDAGLTARKLAHWAPGMLAALTAGAVLLAPGLLRAGARRAREENS